MIHVYYKLRKIIHQQRVKKVMINRRVAKMEMKWKRPGRGLRTPVGQRQSPAGGSGGRSPRKLLGFTKTLSQFPAKEIMKHPFSLANT